MCVISAVRLCFVIHTCRFVFLCLAFLSLQYALRVKVQPGTVLTALFKVERSFKQLKKFFSELDMTAGAG